MARTAPQTKPVSEVQKKVAYPIRPAHIMISSRPGSDLHRHSCMCLRRSRVCYCRRRHRRLPTFVALLACIALACLTWTCWLFTTEYSSSSASQRTAPEELDAPLTALHASYEDPNVVRQLDIGLDEPKARFEALRADLTTRYLAYLPHSGLHNQRIALENAITLARLLNRTLLVPPARLGPKTLHYVRSSTLSRMLELSDKQQGRNHCAHIPVDVPQPDECIDYMAYTFVAWAWLVDLGPIEAQQPLVRASNGTAAWMEEWLGIGPNETLFLPDTEPYEYQFVDTPAPAREGVKFLRTIPIDTLAAVPQRLIQFGTLFGSSRLRLREAQNRRVRKEVRRHMVFANAAFTLASERIRKALGGMYVGAHVRVGDGQFQEGARANVRLVWRKLVHGILGLDAEATLGLERDILMRMGETRTTDGKDDRVDVGNVLEPPEITPDVPSLRVPHPPLAPLPATFSPKLPCRNRMHTTPSLRRLNIPLFVATDTPAGLDDPLLGPLLHAFPCAFTLASFGAETAHLDQLRNGYDGVRLGEHLAPIVDALMMGGAWAMVGTEGSTFSRYVEDVLWRVSHGWEIVQRG